MVPNGLSNALSHVPAASNSNDVIQQLVARMAQRGEMPMSRMSPGGLDSGMPVSRPMPYPQMPSDMGRRYYGGSATFDERKGRYIDPNERTGMMGSLAQIARQVPPRASGY